ncbi:MAG: Zinc/iron permease [Monoraphidium minutum]|nr:MAG: Zinc/iron permease [Monoraphidium minutum]
MDAAAEAAAAAAAAAACNSGAKPYDRGLAIGAIFIIAAASFLGFLAPAALRRHGGRHTQVAVVAASATGTGVLLGVSLVHILADAEASLSSPCLPRAWLDAFPNWGTLICAATLMMMIILDYVLQGVFERKFERQEAIVEAAVAADPAHSHPLLGAPRPGAASLRRGGSSFVTSSLNALDLPMHGAALRAFSVGPPIDDIREGCDEEAGCGAAPAGAAAAAPQCREAELAAARPGQGPRPSAFQQAAKAPPPAPVPCGNAGGGGGGGKEVLDFGGDCHGGGNVGAGLPEEAALALKRGAVIFVEGSVCTHSIPVGLALGMAGEDAFVSLLVAVIVHQMLEGLGVGAAALDAQYPTRSLLGLASCFSVTAPLGIALGVGLHSVLREDDPRYLMALGIVNAIASGMLLYVAIEHMNAIGSKGVWLRRQHWAAQATVVLCFVAGGAALMLIGKYA